MQRDSGVAARHRRRNRVRYHSVRIHKELEAEAVIIHTGADAVEDLGMQHRVDKYVHCQHTVRPRHGCQPHRAVARRIEGYTVPRYRQIVLTNDAVHAFNDIVIDIEYECNRTVTSLDIWNHDCIGPRLRVRCANKRVGQVIFINRFCDGAGSRHQDRETQICHRIAPSGQ